ncbi:MAG: DHA2 family efflux MFS transporter permease subunit [Bacteroidia bacterium]|nr:MAG: DHA2 family efflux MFS transporter permease subunit [Bacteroidia bacterium]
MSSKKSGFTSIQKWTLLACILASSLVFMDSTALNVALPALQEDLGITGTELLWIINGYALFLSALLLLGGSLGDLYGRNKVFLTGLGIFSMSSLICGISQNPLQLILARAFQGIGGALLIPGSLSILSSQFGVAKRGRAIGLWSTFSALTAVFGPVLGGWLAGRGLWRIIFFLNVPLSVVVFISTIARIPESRNPEAQKLDVWGAILVTAGLAGITYGFIESPKQGFGNIIIVSSLFIGGISLIGFMVIQRYSNHPMMPLKLFKSRTFSGANLLTLFVYAALGGSMFFLPLNLIQIQGYSELQAGLALLPMIVLIAGISTFIGKYSDKMGARIPLIIGPIITSVGFFLFSTYGITSGPGAYWTSFFISFLLLGTGMGITVALLTTAVMGAVSEDHAGIASGINNTIARSAGVLAVALLGAMVLYTFTKSIEGGIEVMDISKDIKNEIVIESSNFAAARVPDGLSVEKKVLVKELLNDSFVGAFNRIVYVASLLTLLGGLMSIIFIRNKK